MVHGPGPRGGPWTGSMDQVREGGPWTGSTGVIHGPGSMFCTLPTLLPIKTNLPRANSIKLSEGKFKLGFIFPGKNNWEGQSLL